MQADYLFGWLNTTIHDFLSAIRKPQPSMNYALITCLDSEFDVPALLEKSKHLKHLKTQCRMIGSGVLLPTHHLLATAQKDRIFFGFDEVWFFPRPEVSPKPQDLIITGPETINAQEMDTHSDWMRSNHCALGLGDGTGMNFCLRVRGVPRDIVQIFNLTGSSTPEEDREPVLPGLSSAL